MTRINSSSELLKADKRAVRQQTVAPPAPDSPPKPLATKSDSPISVGGRKFFTPPLPRPMASSPIQRPARPALVYAEEEEVLDAENERPYEHQRTAPVNAVVEEEEDLQVKCWPKELAIITAINQDLFVLDFDMPNQHYQHRQPEPMDIDTADDDEANYDLDAFQRASAMYPSSSGSKLTRPNHLATATPKRKNNLDDFIQVTPRGRAVQTKPAQAQQSTASSQHTNGTNANSSNTLRAPIGPSFSTYRYKQTAKKSASTSTAEVLGCCADHRQGPTV